MRFPNHAAVEDLQALMAPCDDDSASHIFWIRHDGEVCVTPTHEEKMSLETRALLIRAGAVYIEIALRRGQSFVGPEAAADRSWVGEYLNHLGEGWFSYQRDRSKGRFRTSEIKGTPELLALLECLEKV